ncbi:hypothetical protein L210DRAFT_989331 [Boletus edulis BED1]|uniref:Methyltransferase FkbM domain-containing protein n=1 Tax=Boletus edulis BED1 TaxID=1328754 RepID=A0AAD4G7V9_BOLED|nr:hypothetical protein L210DRAFT_989331 [Boletus edulis BED1]
MDTISSSLHQARCALTKKSLIRVLIKRNGHDFIDVLKIDIEGGEFDSLEVFIDSFDGIKFLERYYPMVHVLDLLGRNIQDGHWPNTGIRAGTLSMVIPVKLIK